MPIGTEGTRSRFKVQVPEHQTLNHFAFKALPCVLLLQNVFSYYRMCSLTIECVLLQTKADLNSQKVLDRRLYVPYVTCHIIIHICHIIIRPQRPKST